MTLPLISIDNVSVVVGKRHLLDSVTFDVNAGEYVVIIGRNGSGKTTLLKTMLGLRKMNAGNVMLNGADIVSLSRIAIASQVAYLQQLPEVGFAFTVRQIVEMGRYPHQKPLIPASKYDGEVVERVMNDVGVADIADRKVETLSGGERQKVLLAAALAQEPNLLLLDEPTTFLDVGHQQEIAKLLQRFHEQQNVTVIEISHDINRAAVTATKIVALKSGKVVYDGDPKELIPNQTLEKIFDTKFERINCPERSCPLVV
ncbi:MAG: ABC transporter ATP-binding protein [Planctomycetaceae bacterium]|jgi:iron complex transport system ATP-binding protein|nr:ABC transporter ATP-binding protein [Planctomycetaceae bacterium]